MTLNASPSARARAGLTIKQWLLVAAGLAAAVVVVPLAFAPKPVPAPTPPAAAPAAPAVAEPLGAPVSMADAKARLANTFRSAVNVGTEQLSETVSCENYLAKSASVRLCGDQNGEVVSVLILSRPGDPLPLAKGITLATAIVTPDATPPELRHAIDGANKALLAKPYAYVCPTTICMTVDQLSDGWSITVKPTPHIT